ncbi:MAG TPA: hypothetical protein DCW52_05910, partial [Gammaproteobacteria bacterium]|nr:hypothetical protein [Gammaproteobacteria bacterium]
MFDSSSRAFVALFILLSFSSVYAQTKVVVVPLGGDDPVTAICVALGSTAGCDLATVIAGTASAYYKIGDNGPAGGTVFYITDGGLHGLEAAPANSPDSPPVNSPNSVWGCSGTSIAGTSTAIGTGAANTAAIVAGCVSGEVTAAEVANAYELNGFADWFLPSKGELNLLYLQKDVVGSF